MRRARSACRAARSGPERDSRPRARRLRVLGRRGSGLGNGTSKSFATFSAFSSTPRGCAAACGAAWPAAPARAAARCAPPRSCSRCARRDRRRAPPRAHRASTSIAGGPTPSNRCNSKGHAIGFPARFAAPGSTRKAAERQRGNGSRGVALTKCQLLPCARAHQRRRERRRRPALLARRGVAPAVPQRRGSPRAAVGLERISKLPPEDSCAGEPKEAEKVLGPQLVASDEAAATHQPGIEPLDEPASFVATELAEVL